jgi:hypothetical protein
MRPNGLEVWFFRFSFCFSDKAFFDVKYPDILWRDLIPAASIRTDINKGARSHAYQSRDVTGMGQFVRGDTRNISMVGQSANLITVPMLNAAVGSKVTDFEANEYAFGFQADLTRDLGEVMRKAAEYHVERSIVFGDDLAGFEPYVDYTGITAVPLDAWDDNDVYGWVESLVSAMTNIITGTKTVHIPNVMEVPPTIMSKLLMPMTVGSAGPAIYTSGLDYLKRNNYYTATTGGELTVKPVRYLEGAGTAGADRIILKEDNPTNFLLPFPTVYELAQPVPVALGVEIYAVYKFGSFHVRYPGCMAYIDIAQSEES